MRQRYSDGTGTKSNLRLAGRFPPEPDRGLGNLLAHLPAMSSPTFRPLLA